MTALYIHIPFCARKCAYCDFTSYAGRSSSIDAYLAALEREMSEYRGTRIETVYIGGGTPTMLSPKQLTRLLSSVSHAFEIAPDVEFSSESNPGTLDADKLSAMRGGGVNRLSMGAQSMNDELLDIIGRIHSAKDVEKSVSAARKAGFGNINLDLMYGLPGQTAEMLCDSVKMTSELGVTHISMYSLINEEGTPLTRRIESGELSVPDEDELADMEEKAYALIRSLGFERYEISNFARPGYECRHNIAYWTRGDYIGLGIAAHSFVGGKRFSNGCDLDEYIADGPRREYASIEGREAEFEQIMLETRLARGIDITRFNIVFDTDFYAKYARPVSVLLKNGCAEADPRFFRLTDNGLNVQNTCVIMLTDVLDGGRT